MGRVRGRMRALLTALEYVGVADAHAWPRPFESRAGRRRYAIGLGLDPIDATTLAEASTAWLRALPGVRIERVDGGAVPTLA